MLYWECIMCDGQEMPKEAKYREDTNEYIKCRTLNPWIRRPCDF